MSPTPPPTPSGHPLPRSTPEEQGIPSGAVLALVRRWEAQGLEPHSVRVLRHGHVVAEGSWAPYRCDGIALLYSVSKTFTACAVGFAVAEGLLSLDDRVVELFPDAAHAAGPRAAALTLHDLLAMRTGHRVDTLTWRRSRPGEFPQTFLGTEPEEEKGWFVYHNGATLMAALAVQRRTGQRLLDYLRPRLLGPLGIDAAEWDGQDGVDAGYSGLHVGTDALAAFGELVLRDGRWDGRQLLPEGWVESMTTRHTDTSMHPGKIDWQQGYGYQVWRCRHDAVRADGAYGQFSVVVPGADLVLALTSCSERTQETLDAIWEELLPALADGALPAAPTAHGGLVRYLDSARVPAPRSPAPAVGNEPGPWEFVHAPTEEVQALTLVAVRPAEAGGWHLTLTEQRDGHEVEVDVRCADGGWPPSDGTPWVASGGWPSPGVFEARIVAVETPHALLLRCTDGVATATWNGVPLNRPVLSTVRGPRGAPSGAWPWSR